MTRAPVTAVVCTRDRSALLARSLPAILASLTDGDELLVIESGGRHADAVVDALGPTTAGPAVRVLRSEVAAKSHKLNLAIAAAGGEVVLLTDDDVDVPESWADDLVAAVLASDEVGVAFGPVLGLSGIGPAPRLPAGDAPLQTWAYAHGASMALRRSCALDVGGFDPRLGPGAPIRAGEDHDFVLRAWERGWRVVVADAEPVRHLDWRSGSEDLRNLLTYERGAGALVGAALRRRPFRWWKYAVLRLGHEAGLARSRTPDGRRFGTRGLRSFAGGVVYGLRLRPRN